MDGLEQTLKVNKFARRMRHLRIFSKRNRLAIKAKSLLQLPVVSHSVAFLDKAGHLFTHLMPIAPQKRLLFQAGVVGVTAMFISSIGYGSTYSAASLSYSTDYMESYSLPGDILVSDDSGYLVKINPQTDQSSRVGMTDFAVHTVESGESLSVIAERYGVSTSTIMWENNLSNANSLRIGQKLMVPPVNGISYKVASADTLDKIADKYEISVESIIAQNALETDILQKGQEIFLPGAEPLYVAPAVIVDTRNVGSFGDTRALESAYSSTAAPAGSKPFIFPTKGKITQGYHGGHYALDIADRSKPPIWAAGGGTVVKASSGTWGGGYGTHVIIDHGNGLKTLYAHMDVLNVYEGQYVNQGDVIGIMGNTGRVYGATGIHLHFEVIDNGVKQYPANYY